MHIIENVDPNKAVFTLKGIVNSSMPILYVVHDLEDDWQFLCGDEVDVADMMIVSMEQIIVIDPSLRFLSLDAGYEAVRESLEQDWTVRKRLE